MSPGPARSCRGIASAGLLLACAAQGQITFLDRTGETGLGGLNAARVALVDLNADGRADAVVARRRVFLNTPGVDGPVFTEVPDSGLPALGASDVVVFADLDNDGRRDALLARHLDVNNPQFRPPAPPGPDRTAWFPGRGDGTFGEPRLIDAATRGNTIAAAVADVDLDGRLDLFFANAYARAGESLEAFDSDLVLQTRPGVFTRVGLPTDGVPFCEDADAGPRPAYAGLIGVIGPALPIRAPDVLQINYGRRANRVFRAGPGGAWTDVAPSIGLDADDIRHGRYPPWLRELARTDPRFDRPDERPFRANGNGFDAAIHDVNNDGRFDVLLTTIRHGWAGESSDPSRLLLAGPDGRFTPAPGWSLSRAPADPSVRAWNEGDLFGELADLDHDGRVDLLLSSGDYPDQQRLRVWRQQADGRFSDVTPWSGLNNDGSQQLSLADVDLDGDLDILVGQTFNRFTRTQVEGRSPTLKLYLNQTVERRRIRQRQGQPTPGVISNALSIVIRGADGTRVNRDGIGVIVSVTADLDADPGTPPVTQWRQIQGPGGHAGKQREFVAHFGLGAAMAAMEVTVHWPGGGRTAMTGVPPGRLEIGADSAEGVNP